MSVDSLQKKTQKREDSWKSPKVFVIDKSGRTNIGSTLKQECEMSEIG